MYAKAAEDKTRIDRFPRRLPRADFIQQSDAYLESLVNTAGSKLSKASLLMNTKFYAHSFRLFYIV